ncbi:hypothetical protein RUND412_005007 [Rhizina undulata]
MDYLKELSKAAAIQAGVSFDGIGSVSQTSDTIADTSSRVFYELPKAPLKRGEIGVIDAPISRTPDAESATISDRDVLWQRYLLLKERAKARERKREQIRAEKLVSQALIQARGGGL